MTFTSFEEKILIALYQEQIHFGQNELVSFRDAANKYGLDSIPGWLLEAQKNLRRQGRISGPTNVLNDDMAVGKIAATGIKYIENKYGDKSGVGIILNPITQPLSELPEGLSRASGNIFLSDRAPPANFGSEGDIFFEYGSNTGSVDSSKWTGLPSGFQLEDSKRTRLSAELGQMEESLSSLGLNQETYSQARAYIVAARVLSDAPEPPADVIWEIINRANQVAGIASLFVSIMALFVK